DMSSKASVTPSKRTHEVSPPPSKMMDKLRDDAYAISVEANNAKEVNYPYISYCFLMPIDRKHKDLKPYEVANFYTEHHIVNPYLPKDYTYYQAILAETDSVVFSPTERSANEWAFSKFIIKRVISYDDWGDSLFKQKELNFGKPRYFNYFDYMIAWSGALIYKNRQKKFSWFIQFQLDKESWEFPSWFYEWFFN
ncbi:hypothetical protein P3X46_022169, partial [Hevea brasiliensis]